MMGLGKYSSKGYYDPTADMAIGRAARDEKIDGNLPMVFICSPFAGKVIRNVDNARKYCRFAVSKNKLPIAPHLLFPQFLDDKDKEQRKLGLSMGMQLMKHCHEVWVFGNEVTDGMAKEIRKAEKRKKHVRYFTESCVEVDGK